jgi:hypothetical protein
LVPSVIATSFTTLILLVVVTVVTGFILFRKN